MVRLRINTRRLLATKSIVAGGAAALAAGVWVNWGLGWGLITAGVAAAAYGLLLVDVGQESR